MKRACSSLLRGQEYSAFKVVHFELEIFQVIDRYKLKIAGRAKIMDLNI